MERLKDLIHRYRTLGLLIDTNLLLLYFLGLIDIDLISRHKRLKEFTSDDFDLIAGFASRFDTLVTTPNVLTEVVNLAGQCGEPDRGRILAAMALHLGILGEHYVESRSIIAEPAFGWLGLTDVGIGRLTAGRFLVLTNDLPLTSHLSSIGVDCINFNHLRAY